jgi:hypothetical protein
MTDVVENDEIRMSKDEEMSNYEARNNMSIVSGRPLSLIRHSTFVLRHLLDASRHSQMQRIAAMMSATQLSPIGI